MFAGRRAGNGGVWSTPMTSFCGKKPRILMIYGRAMLRQRADRRRRHFQSTFHDSVKLSSKLMTQSHFSVISTSVFVSSELPDWFVETSEVRFLWCLGSNGLPFVYLISSHHISSASIFLFYNFLSLNIVRIIIF